MNHKLTTEQKNAVEYLGGHMQIIACAGSGKTTVLSKRVAHLIKNGTPPHQIVAFTFTEKAAESLKSHIESAAGCSIAGMYIGTIHGFCKHLLSRYTQKFADFKILDTVKNHLFISRYSDCCGIKDLDLTPTLHGNALFLQCIDKLIDDYHNNANWQPNHQTAFNNYIDSLYSHGYIDFSLLIFEALRQIEESSAVKEYLKNIRHLIVDEYQDVNDIQEKLIASIASFGTGLCVVGDDDQTIYQFRGSNADNMISFCNRYPNVHTVHLNQNFRCTKEIADIASCVIGHNKHRLSKQIFSNITIENSEICANGYSSSDDEYMAIADTIVSLHKQGVPFGKIAVLTRKGKHISQIASKLAQKNIPYSADSADSFFNGNYFKRFSAALGFLHQMDRSALREQWKDIISPEHFNAGFKYLRSCPHGGCYRLSDILRTFCQKVDFLSDENADLNIRIEDLNGFCKILDDYDEIYGDYQLSVRVWGLINFLAKQATQEYKYHNFSEQALNTDVVQLMTVHKSKGLEFHTVFLPGLNKREFPVANIGGKKYYHVLGGEFAANKNKYESDTEDERKLFYVALTRAEQNLYLSYTLQKQPVSEFVANAAKSKFLKIDRNDLLYSPPNSAENREKLKKQRQQEQAEREEYFQLVNYARDALYDYYAIGNRFCPGIIGEYQDICVLGGDAIIQKALECGLI